MAVRYFLTINASRPYVAGGLTFSFEPVQNRGGSWLGVLAVENDSAASTLAAAELFGVEEIIADRYDSIKKKVTGTPGGSSASPKRRPVPIPASAGGVRLVEPRGGTLGAGNPLIKKPAPVAEALPESVTLKSTSVQPPSEALLDSPSMKSNRRYTPNKIK